MTRTNSAAVLIISTLLLSVILFPAPALAQTDDINAARQQIITCYNAAKEAETAGANITSLTFVLNDAGTLLSQAELASSKGDSALANTLAAQSRAKLTNFVSEADALKETALQQQYNAFLILMASIVGTFVVLGVGLGVWFFLNKRERETGETDL